MSKEIYQVPVMGAYSANADFVAADGKVITAGAGSVTLHKTVELRAENVIAITRIIPELRALNDDARPDEQVIPPAANTLMAIRYNGQPIIVGIADRLDTIFGEDDAAEPSAELTEAGRLVFAASDRVVNPAEFVFQATKGEARTRAQSRQATGQKRNYSM